MVVHGIFTLVSMSSPLPCIGILIVQVLKDADKL